MLRLCVRYLLALALGIAIGVYPFIGELLPKNAPEQHSQRWETYDYDQEKYQKALEASASFDTLLEITPPADNAPIEKWLAFMQQLDSTPLSKRHDNGGATTPLMAWYAYVAKHKPEALIQGFGEFGFHQSKLDVLIRYGLLANWDDYVGEPDNILLESRAALAAYTYRYGFSQAQTRYKQALFKKLQHMDVHRQRIDLANIPFIADSLSDNEVEKLSELLLNRPIIIDPRDIKLLTATGRFQRSDLLSLMRRHAYSQKMMSSYKLHGAQLGASEYIEDVIPDLTSNAKQPTNFYCSACVLAVLTDGLIGTPLLTAYNQGRVTVEPDGDGEYLFKLADHGQLLTPAQGEILQKPNAYMEWSR